MLVMGLFVIPTISSSAAVTQALTVNSSGTVVNTNNPIVFPNAVTMINTANSFAGDANALFNFKVGINDTNVIYLPSFSGYTPSMEGNYTWYGLFTNVLIEALLPTYMGTNGCAIQKISSAWLVVSTNDTENYIIYNQFYGLPIGGLWFDGATYNFISGESLFGITVLQSNKVNQTLAQIAFMRNIGVGPSGNIVITNYSNVVPDCGGEPMFSVVDINGNELVSFINEPAQGTRVGRVRTTATTTENITNYNVLRLEGFDTTIQADDKRGIILKGEAFRTNGIGGGCFLIEVNHGNVNVEQAPYAIGIGQFNNPLYIGPEGKSLCGNLGDLVDGYNKYGNLPAATPVGWWQIRGQSSLTPALILEPGKLVANPNSWWMQGAIQYNGTNFYGTTKSVENETNNYQFLMAGLPGNGSGITNLNGNTLSVTATNRLVFTSVSALTNTLGREAFAIVSAGTSVVLQDTNGVSIATLGTIATLDLIVPMHVNMRLSGTGVSAILY